MHECIVRMKKYGNCLDCDLHQIVYGDSYADTDVYCFKEKRLVGKRFGPAKDLARPDWCPIICSLPEGHGRLGDLDELAAGCDAPYWCRWLSEIEDAPTIVPAGAERKVDEPDAVSPTDTPTDTPTVPAERSET